MNLLELPDDILTKIKYEVDKLQEREEDFQYADEGIAYLKKHNMLEDEIEVNEMLYDRLYKIGYSWYDISQYKRERNITFKSI